MNTIKFFSISINTQSSLGCCFLIHLSSYLTTFDISCNFNKKKVALWMSRQRDTTCIINEARKSLTEQKITWNYNRLLSRDYTTGTEIVSQWPIHARKLQNWISRPSDPARIPNFAFIIAFRLAFSGADDKSFRRRRSKLWQLKGQKITVKEDFKRIMP